MSVDEIGEILKICATYTAIPNILTAYDLLDTVLNERLVRGKKDLYESTAPKAQDLASYDQKCLSFAHEYLQNSAANKYSPSLTYAYTSLMQETLCHGEKEFTHIVAIAVLSTTNADEGMLNMHLQEAKAQGYSQDFFKEMALHMEKYAGSQSTIILRSKL